MELNTINKTGTWSETADRLNNNFSKTSTEVEKVKQNAIRNKGLFPTVEALQATVPVSYTHLTAVPFPVNVEGATIRISPTNGIREYPSLFR